MTDPLNYDELVSLDAENLAEQGILSAYEELLPELEKHISAAPIQISEEIDNDRARYVVHAQERSYEIWEDGAQNVDGWERATVAFFEIVNSNLESAAVKFYALYGGNDLSGMFLTEAQFEAARKALPRRSDWPWMPVEQSPHYGYPGAV